MQNAEIKAEVTQAQVDALIALANGQIEEDTQTDVYYKVPEGRLKLRTSRLENFLVAYKRVEVKGQKTSKYQLLPALPEIRESLIKLLDLMFEQEVTVIKNRKIFYIGQTKFHIDEVYGLSNRKFIEIEVRDENESQSLDELHAILKNYMKQLDIKDEQTLDKSYMDLLKQH